MVPCLGRVSDWSVADHRPVRLPAKRRNSQRFEENLAPHNAGICFRKQNEITDSRSQPRVTLALDRGHHCADRGSDKTAAAAEIETVMRGRQI